MHLQRYKTFEGKWRGEINDSILIITHHLCELIDQQTMLRKRLLYVVIGTLCIALIFSIPNSLDIRTWLDTKTDTGLMIGMAIGTGMFTIFSKHIKSCADKIKEMRKLLIKRINADFCPCNKPCNHKEEYLAEVLSICKINLYY